MEVRHAARITFPGRDIGPVKPPIIPWIAVIRRGSPGMAVKHALHAGRRHRASLHWSIRGQTRARGGAAVKRREESDGGDAGQHRLARAHQRNSPPNPVESILAHLALQTKADARGPGSGSARLAGRAGGAQPPLDNDHSLDLQRFVGNAGLYCLRNRTSMTTLPKPCRLPPLPHGR